MIRVLHVTEDHSVDNTGISSAVDALTRCVPEEIHPEILCVGPDPISSKPGVPVTTLPMVIPGKFWRFSNDPDHLLRQAVAECDVLHFHGLWMWIQWAAARCAIQLKKPFVITPHGMLEPWIWRRQSWPHQLKKFLYWNGIAYPVFRSASLVHALTSREAQTLSNYFRKKETVILPHGMDFHSTGQILESISPSDLFQKPYFLFLGRLHPVKGIHNLIRAFSCLPVEDFRLIIAGPTQVREQAYAESLHQLASELGISQRITFTGAVAGMEKWRLYRNAWAFCLPSYSEAFPMVNLEAGAAGTPVITTAGTGIESDWDRNGGILIEPTEQSIMMALKQAIEWSREERLNRGAAVQVFVKEHFSWERIGKEWSEVYGRMIKAGCG